MATLIAAFAALVLLLLLLWCPWLSIALLLVLPVVKAGAEYYVPLFQQIDLTAAVCTSVGALALWNLVRRADRKTPLAIPWKLLGCLLVLGFALCVSLAWTSAPDYGLRKAYRFVGIGIPYLLLPCFLIRSEQDAQRTLRTIMVVGVLIAMAIILLPRTYLEQTVYGRGYLRTTVWASSPVISATIISLGLLCHLAGLVLPGGLSRAARYSTIILLPLGLFAILKTGTRSVLFGTLAATVLLPLLAGQRSRLKALFLLFVAIPLATGVGIAYVDATTTRTVERWTRIIEPGGRDELVEGRAYHYSFCLLNWWKRPLLGHGTGSFAVDAFGKDEPAWPHNIILEAMYETGLAGTCALLAFLLITVRMALRGLRLAVTPPVRFLATAPTACLVMLLTQSLSHADLDGARLLFLFAGVLFANLWQVKTRALQPGPSSPARLSFVGRPRLTYG